MNEGMYPSDEELYEITPEQLWKYRLCYRWYLPIYCYFVERPEIALRAALRLHDASLFVIALKNISLECLHPYLGIIREYPVFERILRLHHPRIM